jgi:hypothetical protein
MEELGLELEPALLYFIELELEVLYKSQVPPNTGYFVAHKYLPAGCIPD